ncbi:hypothetical protein Nepgr_019044 [Nepenthes gracilis]|uniref:Hyaluronan/mRNA-binding protein domain-containing protein n=1 Tax=Nepenthes gracilis TaxID=150966 RepID=A0AAD3XU10_NEPGR|nr:hypothetical protein Nepgr_019044 [Nepenthes gracilis]
MATANPFDLLEDNDNDDPSQLIASALAEQQQKAASAPKKAPAAQNPQANLQPKPTAKLPSKPLPPAQAVREAKSEAGRGGRGGRRGSGRGHGGSGINRDNANHDNAVAKAVLPGSKGASEEGESGKPYERRSFGGPSGPYSGGRRGFNEGEARDGERPRRMYERQSGSGRGNEIKREGSGRGNWGTQTDEIALVVHEEVDQSDKNFGDEKLAVGEDALDGNKDTPLDETEEKEPEEKEMTLEEYEKSLKEKRKALQALKTEERKVEFDKEFESMQPLSSKRDNDTIFIKLAAGKDKRKEATEKDEKGRSLSALTSFSGPVKGRGLITQVVVEGDVAVAQEVGLEGATCRPV